MGRKCEFLNTDAKSIDSERGNDKSGDVVTDSELEIGFGVGIFEKDSRVEDNTDPSEVGHGEVIDEKEVNIMHKEVFEDESDRFLVLEKAIADGIDLLDKILECMENGEEPKKDKKVKKVKENKVKTVKKVNKESGKHLKN